MAVDSTFVHSSFSQSASAVKQGGKWILTGNKVELGDSHKAALEICEKRGVSFSTGDYGRYWFLPEFVALAGKHIPHMLEACNKLYADGIHVRVSKVIPLELTPMAEELKAVGDPNEVGR